MASSNKKSDAKAKSLASKLAGVAAKAKGMGIDTRRADAMVAQTNRQGGNSFNGTREERAMNKSFAITPEKLVTAPTPPVPPITKVTDPGDVTGAGNAGLVTGIDGATIKDGQFVMPTPVEPTSSTDTTGYQQNMQSYINNLIGNKPVDNEAIYNKAEREVGLNRAQKEVNKYTAQLNAITASSQAEQLKLEGQGRGQTGGFIGGEQARINREAAIQALPVQAQLAAAQGNLEFAQQRLDTLFKIRSADAQAKYDFNNKIYSTYYDFANTIQKTKLDALKLKEDRAYDEKKTAIADAKTIAMQAIEYGQSSLAARIMGLDPSSATYAQDVAKAMGELRKPVAATSASSDWELKDVNGVTSWVNKYTQEIKPAGDGGATGAPDAVQKSLDQLSFLRNTAKDAIANASDRGIFRTPVGPSLITQGIGNTFIGNTAFKQLQNQTDTLKTNVLSLMTDPNVKKFFGPQMSNADVRLMSSTGSTLNPAEQEPEDYIKEVQRLDALFNRMQTAVQQGLAGQITRSSNVITAPDGLLIEIID